MTTNVGSVYTYIEELKNKCLSLVNGAFIVRKYPSPLTLLPALTKHLRYVMWRRRPSSTQLMQGERVWCHKSKSFNKMNFLLPQAYVGTGLGKFSPPEHRR